MIYEIMNQEANGRRDLALSADFPLGLKAAHTITVFHFSGKSVCLSTVTSNTSSPCSLPNFIHRSKQEDPC